MKERSESRERVWAREGRVGWCCRGGLKEDGGAEDRF